MTSFVHQPSVMVLSTYFHLFSPSSTKLRLFGGRQPTDGKTTY
jgi:hypothetical protein